jgi:restriction system protein
MLVSDLYLMEIIHHYPPELLALLIDTIPKLCRSKRDLLTFFKGAGVGNALLNSHEHLLRTDKSGFNKYVVAREILVGLNDLGETSLRERREILKRVTEFQDFSVCWAEEQAPARGLVAQIRELVNVKDSFTRINLERENERKARMAEEAARSAAERARREKLARIRTDLFALFGEANAQKRGKRLEAVLNELFATHGLLVREAFTVKGWSGEGVIEQIDGLIEMEGLLYLVELKWWKTPLGTAEVSPHIVRVFSRGGQARGVFISYSEFTEPAIATCREAIAGGGIVVLATLQELVELLDRDRDLQSWLKAKVTAAIADKNPYYRPPI